MRGWTFGVHRFTAPELRGRRADLGSISAPAGHAGALAVRRATGGDGLPVAWRAGGAP